MMLRISVLTACLLTACGAYAEERSATEALAEVNALRAARGLAPFTEDPGLTIAAEKAADYRALYLIEGHTSNDFQFLPAGESADAAGCAAWEPSWGWGACTTFEHWKYAGAAYSLGRDGRRYMHIFVRRGNRQGSAVGAYATTNIGCTTGTCLTTVPTYSRSCQATSYAGSCGSSSHCRLFGRRGHRCR